MEQVTDQEVDDAIDILVRFVRDFLDTSAKNTPDVDEVRTAVRTLVDANRFNPEDYEIKNLLRVSESKKASRTSSSILTLSTLLLTKKNGVTWKSAGLFMAILKTKIPFRTSSSSLLDASRGELIKLTRPLFLND